MRCFVLPLRFSPARGDCNASHPRARYFINENKLVALGWAAKMSWEDGLRNTVDWDRSNVFEACPRVHFHTPRISQPKLSASKGQTFVPTTLPARFTIGRLLARVYWCPGCSPASGSHGGSACTSRLRDGPPVAVCLPPPAGANLMVCGCRCAAQPV